MGAPIVMRALLEAVSEIALYVRTYNLTWVPNILGVQPLMAQSRTKGTGL